MKKRNGRHQGPFLESAEAEEVLGLLNKMPGVSRVIVGKRFAGRGESGLVPVKVRGNEVTVKAKVSSGTFMLHVHCADPSAVVAALKGE